MRDGLLWIVAPDLIDAAIRARIEQAQAAGVPLFIVEGTVVCQGADGEPMIEIERSEVMSSFTARHLRFRSSLQRHL